MKSTKFVLSVLSLFAFAILFTSFVAAEVTFTDASSAVQDAEHDSQITITFNLLSTGFNENVTLDLPVDFFGPGTVWGGDFETKFELLDGEEFPVELTLKVPAHQDPKDYTGQIDLTGALNGVAPLDLKITVTPSSTLGIDTFTAPTKDEKGTLELMNTGNVDLTKIAFTTTGNIELDTIATIDSLLKGKPSSVINLIIDEATTILKFGFNPTTITAKADDGTQVTQDFKIKETFCDSGENATSLSIKNVKIDNRDGSNDDWKVFDRVEVTVEIKNNGADDVDEVQIELGFFDKDGSNLADDFDWTSKEDELYDLGSIKDDKKKSHKFEFRVPAEFADLSTSDKYMLAVKAYSDDLGENVECVDSADETELSDGFFESINLETEDDEGKFVVVDDIIFDRETYTCGETVSGRFTVFNIGEDDQDKVLITIGNDDLNVNDEVEITSEMLVGDKEEEQFSFKLPNGLSDGDYNINFKTEYQYDSGIYELRSDDTFIGTFNVAECSGSSNNNNDGDALISVDQIDSDIKAGDEVTITTRITNLGPDEAEFVIDLTEYQSWASLVSISKTSLTLGSGNSEEVTIVLEVDKDASGEQTFTIQTISGQNIDTRDVIVSLEETGNSFLTGLSIGNLGSGGVWLLVLINVILIVLIIVVAVRVSRH